MPLEKPTQEPEWSPTGPASDGQAGFACSALGDLIGCPLLFIGLALALWWYLR